MDFTVLISAYSINPCSAMDDGIAWQILRALDRKFRLIVVTHPRNRTGIERFLSSSPEAADLQARFEYYEPPLTPRVLIPAGTLLQKYYWHWGVVSFIRRRNLQFDVAHQLSLPCGWRPSFLWRLGKPFIWGPVGYPPLIPSSYLRPYGRLTQLKEWFRWGIKRAVWRLDPFVGIAAVRADHIFTIDQRSADELKLSSERTTLLPAIPIYDHKQKLLPDTQFKILCAGSFSPHSGFDLAIRAFELFFHQLSPGERQKAELIILGHGPAEKTLRRMAQATGLPAGAIRFIHSNNRRVFSEQFSRAKLFFSPNHDQSNRLLPQALAHGLPVLCFDQKDTYRIVGDCCSLSAPAGDYTESIEGFARQLLLLFQQPALRAELARGARQKFERQLTWAGRGDTLAEVYWNVYYRNALLSLTDN
jgi:glycosyltransferase involved in cell wall biosynthesis